jgi:hypothetical protein
LVEALALFAATQCRTGRLFLLVGCQTAPKIPRRPATVPPSAFWSGGLDGGAWYDCSEDKHARANTCAIYSDRDGRLWIKARYRLKGDNRSATKEEFLNPVIDHIPDATEIYLHGGKKLVAFQVLYQASEP